MAIAIPTAPGGPRRRPYNVRVGPSPRNWRPIPGCVVKWSAAFVSAGRRNRSRRGSSVTILMTWRCACRMRRSIGHCSCRPRGALRKELTTWLPTGRTQRCSHKRTEHSGTGRLRQMVLISDRPPAVADRAIPGHWEGDLIVGQRNRSAIGTLVGRSSRYVVLLHLPRGRTAEHVRRVLTRQFATLPTELTRTLTWDQGKEMAEHAQFTPHERPGFAGLLGSVLGGPEPVRPYNRRVRRSK